MAEDLWPYSGRTGGGVTDLEHEALWTPIADGVLPGESAAALSVSVAGGSWTVQPGRFHIAGHVLALSATVTGAVPAPATSVRQCVVAAYVDRTQAPWTYGVKLILGTPGGARPALTTSSTGRYEVALRAFDVSSAGAVTLRADERPILSKVGAESVGPWKALTLVSNFTTKDHTPQYRLTDFGRRAEFRGSIRRTDGASAGASTGPTLATVPAEARPTAGIQRFAGQAGLTGTNEYGLVRVEIEPGGKLRVYSQVTTDWFGIYGGIWLD